MLMVRSSPTATPFGPAQAAAQAQEDRRVHNVAHGDVGDRHVYEQPAVHCFQRQPATVIKDNV